MDLALIVIIVAAVAFIAMAVTVRDAPVARPPSGGPTRPGSLDWALDVVDRSVGMYVLRRLTGRPTSRPPEPLLPRTALNADEVAYRTGVADAPPMSEAPVPDGPAGAAAMAAAARAAAAGHLASQHGQGTMATDLPRLPTVVAVSEAPAAVAGPEIAPRERLVRDAGITLLGLAILGLLAIIIWPQGPGGQPAATHLAVTRPTASFRPSALALSSAAPTPVPTPTPTAEPTPEPTPEGPDRGTDARPDPGRHGETGPDPKPTPRPTPRRTPTPTPHPTPTPTPKPTPTPTPTPPPDAGPRSRSSTRRRPAPARAARSRSPGRIRPVRPPTPGTSTTVAARPRPTRRIRSTARNPHTA